MQQRWIHIRLTNIAASLSQAPLSRTALSCALALLLALSGALAATPRAFAATDNIDAEPTEEQLAVEESAAAYEEALAHAEELERQATENEARIAELNELLPSQQERCSESLRVLYHMQEEGFSLLNLLLSAENLTDFMKKLEYITRVQDMNYQEVVRMSAMQAELEEKQESLASDKAAAEEERDRAAVALTEAQAARERAQREAQERAAAEAAAAAAAEEAAKAEQEAQKEADDAANAPSDDASQGSGAEAGTGSSGSTITPPASDNADWSSDKSAFVDSWGSRINAYLSGSPLSGQGRTFAEAAWEYGVDPRWSPAISCIESSKGAACFLPYNAWGWGSISWSSWEEAINAHVRGLARGYGYTISVSAAQKYCPPNWEFWYNRVSEEMNKI